MPLTVSASGTPQKQSSPHGSQAGGMRLLRIVAAYRRTRRNDLMLGAILAFVAGAMNAGGFLAIGTYTSHMTGIISSIADNLALGVFGSSVQVSRCSPALPSGALVCHPDQLGAPPCAPSAICLSAGARIRSADRVCRAGCCFAGRIGRSCDGTASLLRDGPAERDDHEDFRRAHPHHPSHRHDHRYRD